MECTKETLGIDAMARDEESTYLCKSPKVRRHGAPRAVERIAAEFALLAAHQVSASK